MAKSRVTRRQLLVAAAPAVAAVPLAKVALSDGSPSPADHAGHTVPMGHAAMIGRQAPAPGGPHLLDELLHPPPALSHRPGRLREHALVAVDKQIEVASAV